MPNSSIKSSEIFGGEVQYFRLEPKYWETIVQRLKDAGLKGITTYVSWNIHQIEPCSSKHPAGKFDFDGKTDLKLNLVRFLDIVQEAGLLLNFRCGPFCCNEQDFGGQPRELICGDPNLMVWNHKNEPTQGYWIARKEGMQPSYLHPKYLEIVSYWFVAVDAIIKPRLRSNGGCIDMINLDNEISYIVKDSFLDSDYNPVNVYPGGFWHQFLEEKYGDVSGIPYDSKYASIDQIPPPREVPEIITKDMAWYFDWVEFKEWTMCRYITALREMHTSNGCGDVTFMTNFNPHLPEGIPTRMPSFEKAVQGKKQGIVGYDFYRGSFLSWSGYSSMARVLKLMNASVNYTWSAEFMSGTWNKVLPTRVSDDHMRFMARCALAQGCKSIAWFMFHDRRVWGDAPVSSHGHIRDSWHALKQTRALCSEKISHWDSLKPKGDCAIVYDATAQRHTSIGDPSPCNDANLHIGVPKIEGYSAGLHSQEYCGIFRVVEAGGAQPDAVDTEARPERLDQYKLAFLPGSPVLSSATIKALEIWVKSGGCLVVSGIFPIFNDRGRRISLFNGHGASRGEIQYYSGKVIYTDWLASGEPENESLESIGQVKTWIDQYSGGPTVSIKPLELLKWEDWKFGGGVDNAGTKTSDAVHNITTTEQPRILASAILHEGKGFPVLFVLNHYPEAAEFELIFKDAAFAVMRDLDTSQMIDIQNGKAIIDIDRKSGSVFEVKTA